MVRNSTRRLHWEDFRQDHANDNRSFGANHGNNVNKRFFRDQPASSLISGNNLKVVG